MKLWGFPAHGILLLNKIDNKMFVNERRPQSSSLPTSAVLWDPLLLNPLAAVSFDLRALSPPLLQALPVPPQACPAACSSYLCTPLLCIELGPHGQRHPPGSRRAPLLGSDREEEPLAASSPGVKKGSPAPGR